MNHQPTSDNPLLDPGLPNFSSVRAEHALPAVEQRLAEYQAVLETIGKLADKADYANVVEAETLADNALSTAWSTVSHLNGVNNTPEWREAYTSCLEPMTRFATERGQNRALFKAYQALADRPDFDEQSAALKSTVEHELRDFRLAGVDLPDNQRQRFAEINLRLSSLGNEFGNHVLDATEGYSEQLTADDLAGLPESDMDVLAGLATQAGKDGFLANLSYPAYRAIITYADDRTLRERFYRAFATRASNIGPQGGQFDNTPLVTEILALRDEQARLLGFSDHAAMRLSTRMADSADQVERFLHNLAQRARPLAAKQLAELNDYASDLGATTPLEAWDIPYYAEKQREHQLGINQEMLKPWFELKRCFNGLFDVAGELFGLSFKSDDSVDVWHEDVHFYRVINEQGESVAGLYLDIYSRARKSGGAWMDVCRSRMDLGDQHQQPIAYLTCNFAKPSDGKPSLLTHDDVVTLFHEFGHCLHHLLTRVGLPGVGGISGVEWDAVELPSQLMEGWAWEADALNRYARHIETDLPLPNEMLTGLKADRQFHGALALLRQVEFALIDMTMHRHPDADPVAVMRDIHDQIAVTPMPEDNRFIMSFSHLFNGGYAAGYYSYLWAERLARDAFHVFAEQGLFNRDAGQKLAREILEVGASRPMADSWQAFRGKEAELEPLLDAYGVT